MSPLYTLVYLFCFLCSIGYIAFGILQMVLPHKAIPIYRFFLGKRRFARAEPRLLQMKRLTWKFVGAAYICFGMFVTWALMQSLHTQ